MRCSPRPWPAGLRLNGWAGAWPGASRSSRCPGRDQLPAVEHWRSRGSFARLPGMTASAPTLPFRLRHDGIRPAARPDQPLGAPLQGVRILDFSMGWAGPLATRMLADLGADVVKVESTTHPDWWRGWEAGATDSSLLEIRPNFNAVNRGKRGICLDLTAGLGLASAKKLVARSDVVIENFAHGVLAKLGLGLAVQQELRPGVVSVAMPAFGSDGPLSGTRAYGSTVEQASGLPFVNGEASWPPCLQHVAYGDPVAGLYAAAAVVTALAARPWLGGTAVDLSQVACLFELGADAIIAAQLAGGPLLRTGSRRPEPEFCCIVPSAGADAWLLVAAVSAGARESLGTVLGGTGGPGEVTETAVAAWARDRPAGEAAAALQRAGVSAAPVLPAHQLGTDPQLIATGVWMSMDRAYVGRHAVSAPPFRVDGRRPALRGPAPTLGQHTAAVLAEASD